MKITFSSIIYSAYSLFTTGLFFILINSISVESVFAETDNIVPELSEKSTSKDAPLWNGYQFQPSVESRESDKNEGYKKPIATIVPSAKNVTQGDIIYFRLEYENAGASYYWIMGNQRSADRALKVDSSTLKPGKHRVRVTVTNKARQQASSQAFFEVLAKANSLSSNSEPENNSEKSPVEAIEYQGTKDNDNEATEVENTTNITITPTIISLDQGESASFKSNVDSADDYEFRWRFGTQLSDLEAFQISTKDVMPGTYKVFLQVTDKKGKAIDLIAQLIVRDPETDKTRVPNLVGKDIENIADELKAAKLIKGKIDKKNVTENSGKIISQFPDADTEVNINTKIYLVVGVSDDIEMPDVMGKNIDEAKEILSKNSLNITIEKKITDEEEEGQVLSQLPSAGTEVEQGESVKLVVAEVAEKEAIKDKDTELTATEDTISANNPLEVEIETTTLSAEQGTDVIFNAVIKNTAEDEDYSYVWGFGTKKGSGTQFTVKTDELALGEHTVRLQVKNSKNQEANSKVMLNIRVKRLLMPMLENLSLQEAQKTIKEAGLLLGAVEKQQGVVKKAFIKQQSPAFGEYVRPDQPINLVLVIPEKDKNAPVRVDINFDKMSGKAGEPIIFTTKVITKASLSDIHYVYNINNVKKASVDARFTWIPEVEDTYTISVTAYNEGGAIAKSEPYIVNIDTGWEKPIAKLIPEEIEVKQGDKVEFLSRSTYDLNSTLSYEWISSSGHSDNNKAFSIDTVDTNAGAYDVTLTITDDKGNQSTATAKLTIQEILEATQNTNVENAQKEQGIVQFSTDNKAKEKPTVVLSTSRRIAKIGQAIQFNMEVSPKNPKATKVLYYYQLGDKRRRQWMETSAFEHQYNSFGSYSVRAVIKQDGDVYYSDSVTVWVWSPWLLGIAGGLGLLFILIGWWTKRTDKDDDIEVLYQEKLNRTGLEEQIPLSQAAGKDDIVTEKREQDSVKSVLIKGIIQFALGILLSFVILYIILKLMGLV